MMSRMILLMIGIDLERTERRLYLSEGQIDVDIDFDVENDVNDAIKYM